PRDHYAAPLHVDRREAAISRPAQQQAVAGIVAPQNGLDAVEVPRDEEIRVPVAVEVLRQGRVDGRELRLDRQGLQLEGAVAVVQGDGAREVARFQHRGLPQL